MPENLLMTEILKKLDKLDDGHVQIMKEQVKQNETLNYMGQKVGETALKLEATASNVEDIGDTLRKVDDKVLIIDSWKNGMIEYMNQQNEFRLDVIKRLPPLEKDLGDRLDVANSKKKWWQGIGLDVAKTILKGFFYSMLTLAILALSSKNFWDVFAKFL